MARPRVLLIESALPARPSRRLAEALGEARAAGVARALSDRAHQWAIGIAGDESHVTSATGIGDAIAQLFAAGDGPVLAARPTLPVWCPAHDEGALGDLADGCDVSLGPLFDGGFYLLAFARPVPALLALDDDAWNGPDPIALALRAAGEAGNPVGLLRTERGLRTAADVHAQRADPLLDDELRRLLS